MKIGIKVYVYNQVMREKRKEMGYTQKELGELVNTTVSNIGAIELLKSPRLRITHTKTILNNVSHILGLPFEELFPEDYLAALSGGILPDKSSFDWVGEVSLETLGAGDAAKLIEAPKLDEIVDANLLRVKLDESLNLLRRRERLVLRLRYGIYNSQPSMTLGEVANIFGVTRPRIRQIEQHAMAKLRHPTRTRELREYL